MCEVEWHQELTEDGDQGVGGGHQAEPRGLARAGRGPRQRRDSQDPGEQAALQTLVRADQS